VSGQGPQPVAGTTRVPSYSRHVTDDGAHLACPYCGAYGVNRLFLGSLRIDSCECSTCGARWDEDPTTGAFLGRSDRHSVLLRRQS
jgi:hypothetical protein